MYECIQDVKQAIVWVKKHAKSFGGDKNKIFIMGGSAGGHLATLAAVTQNDRHFQAGFEYEDTSVFACISFYGIYNLYAIPGLVYNNDEEKQIRWRKFVSRTLLPFNVSYDSEPTIFYKFSPVHYLLTSTMPSVVPFLLVHGTTDNLVPIAFANEFEEKMTKGGFGWYQE